MLLPLPPIDMLKGLISVLVMVIDRMALMRVVPLAGGNNGSIPPTLEGWVYIIPIHGPLDGPLYTWAQYTPTPPAV